MTTILDHGYVTKIETWGSDERIIEAARMSTGKGFLGWGPALQCKVCGEHEYEAHPVCNASDTETHNVGPHGPPGDEKLLRFLWENKHATPFEMAGATFEVQAPIIVFREWHRHRTQSYNEMSGRYVQLPEMFYVPSAERMMAGGQSASNKQGSGEPIDAHTADSVRRMIREQCTSAFTLYQQMIATGISKEIARVVLPVNTYSRMRASANLRNWLGFLSLRSSAKNPAAQWEIRQFADAVHASLAEAFPRTIGLFDGGSR